MPGADGSLWRVKVLTPYDYDDDSPSGFGDHATCYDTHYETVEAPSVHEAQAKVRGTLTGKSFVAGAFPMAERRAAS